MSEKISVKEYLNDTELLELTYIPYDEKVEICNVIIGQCSSVFEDYHSLNSVLLERVKTEIFITSITNLDFSIKDENGLDGYDQLCYHNDLDYLIYTCGFLYEQFEEIFELALKDYYDNFTSLRSYLNTMKTNVLNWISKIKRDANEFVKSIDSKEVSDKIIQIIDKSGIINK